jgi:peptidoglycan hydrolase-like protein with peptidoglycan-binding domain
MFLAGKAACAGIVLLLLTTGISAPRRTPPALRAILKGVSAVEHGNDIKKLQRTLIATGHYRGKIDGVIGLRTRASIRAYQKAENLPVTGRLDTRTADKLGVTPEVRVETDYQTAQGKPSAGIKWVNGSGRPSKTLRKPVRTVDLATANLRGDSSRSDSPMPQTVPAICDNGESHRR